MRTILGALVVFALLAGGAATAKAQGLVEYALILVIVAKSESGGNQVAIETLSLAHEGIELSRAFEKACGTSRDLQPVCDAVDGIRPGTPAALAIATLAKAGWVFNNSWPVSYKGPAFKAHGKARRGLDVIFTAMTPDPASPGIKVRQIGCDFSSGAGVTTLVQEAELDGALAVARARGDEGERCVDSIQNALDGDLSLREAIELANGNPRVGSFFIPQVDDEVLVGAKPRVRYAELYTLNPE